MRIFTGLVLLCSLNCYAQTVAVSGSCVTGSPSLTKIADINSRAAYQGNGTVDGFANVTISMYYIAGTDNVWVLDFDGQPYYQNPCNTSLPPSTTVQACQWTTVQNTTCAGGTALAISGSGVVPVRLTSFTASRADRQVTLRWETGAEINNKGFSVQKSRNGIEWQQIGFVHGAGLSNVRSNYQFVDNSPASGRNYYRLVQLDFDDHQTISSVVNVLFSLRGYLITRNPGNGLFQLNILSGAADITVFDMHGRKLFSKVASEGIHELDLRNERNGVYLLRILKDNETLTEKLIKQ